MLNRKVNETGGKKLMRKVKSKWVAVAAVGILAGVVAPSSASAWTARSVAEISQDVWETESPVGLDGYLINWGDTLWGLSQATGYSIMDFTDTFGIENADLIYAGDTLRAPTQETAQDADGFYTVVTGDTLSAIAPVFQTTVGQLVAWNNISNPNLIFPGQVLRVTAASEASGENVADESTPAESADEASDEDGGNFAPATPESPEAPSEDNDDVADEEDTGATPENDIADEDDDFGNFAPVSPDEEADDKEDDTTSEDDADSEDEADSEDVDDEDDDFGNFAPVSPDEDDADSEDDTDEDEGDVDYQPELPVIEDDEEGDYEGDDTVAPDDDAFDEYYEGTPNPGDDESEENDGPDDVTYMSQEFDWSDPVYTVSAFVQNWEGEDYYYISHVMSDVWIEEQGLTIEEAYSLAMEWRDEAADYVRAAGYDTPTEHYVLPNVTEFGDVNFRVRFR